MNILLLGSGAREHALAKAIASSKESTLYNIGTHINPGIAHYAERIFVLPFEDTASILAFAKEHRIDWVIIGPEKALELGLADRFWENDIPVIGPLQALARIETSKGFARDLMRKYEIAGTPEYRYFKEYQPEVEDYLRSLGNSYVIKADGLMSGKGVKIAGEQLHDLNEAIAYCKQINGPFVIEEKLFGAEFSLLSFSDGTTLIPMPLVQDHKRLLDGNYGPNTGGMGTYTLANHSLPFLSDEELKEAQAINEAIIAALRQETGAHYRGILYGGFMKTAKGIHVIEFNARFGDPESINLLALLETDFVSICQAMIDGSLDKLTVEFKQQASVCKYIVPKGYPDAGVAGEVLDLNLVQNHESLYYASIEVRDHRMTMLGSRALAVLSLASNLSQAEQQVEETIHTINGSFFHRKDIAAHHPFRIAVLSSTNAKIISHLIDALRAAQLPCELVLILSDKAEAPVLALAKNLNVSAVYLSAEEISRAEYGHALNEILEEHRIDLVLLIGFMRILDKTFTEKWSQQALNVHPSLLPKYAGLIDLAVHKAAIDAGDKESGCTVHFVSEEVDAGPILMQKKCIIDMDDTPEDLKVKVQALEVEALVEAIALFCYSSCQKSLRSELNE